MAVLSKKRPLTIKQKRFIENILVDGNGTKAAIDAGYSAKTAKEIASENLTKPTIKAEIDKRIAQIENKTELSIKTCQAEHDELKALAIAKGDLACATSNVVAKYKTIGAYIDNISNSMPAQDLQQITDEERIELRRIASVRLAGLKTA